jgi:5-methylcytosine-specific restriction enzyme A
MPNLPTASKKTWIAENKGNHSGRIRTEFDKFYHTTAWRKARKAYITAHPLCEECSRHGKITPGTTIDHIVSIKSGGAKLDYSNLQTLCDRCHASKSGKEANQ